MSVVAESIGNSACYHPGCFCCATCGELLVNLTYFRYDSKIYCGRHHAELSKKRCGGCDEVIIVIIKIIIIIVIIINNDDDDDNDGDDNDDDSDDDDEDDV